jgi:hypothetical protein
MSVSTPGLRVSGPGLASAAFDEKGGDGSSPLGARGERDQPQVSCPNNSGLWARASVLLAEGRSGLLILAPGALLLRRGFAHAA